MNEGGTAAYQSESHVFWNPEDVANHVEDALATRKAANAEEEKKLSGPGLPDSRA